MKLVDCRCFSSSLERPGRKEIRERIGNIDELSTLYANVGYSQFLRGTEQLINELRSLTEVEIPDQKAFREAVAEVKKRTTEEGKTSWDGLSDEDKEAQLDDTWQRSYRRLFERLCDTLEFPFDPSSDEVLNEDPLCDVPIEIESCILRKAKNPDRYSKVLDKLEESFQSARDASSYDILDLAEAGGSHDPFTQARETIDRVRNEMQSGLSILSASQLPLIFKKTRTRLTTRRRRELLSFLQRLFFLWHVCKPHHVAFLRESCELAKKYVDTEWMHTPWLTNYILGNIFKPYGPPTPEQLAETENEFPEWVTKYILITVGGAILMYFFPTQLKSIVDNYLPAEMIWISTVVFWVVFYIWLTIGLLVVLPTVARFIIEEVRPLPDRRKFIEIDFLVEEVTSKSYDGREIARRLRKLEDKGIYLPSIVYPLLRLR